ncbi:hypothetical protein JEQ12_018565 [Ovis aries]|uniref:Ig-like domain-containing protein n=1 Tax=Ovis aries TaxID=9940 RepID=A0A836D1T8_SHEEP|nr:hypothetical protein JEQ12_018565 [Ovis aries]
MNCSSHRSATSSSPIFICNCSPIGGLDKDAFDGWMEGLTSEGGTSGDSVTQTEGVVILAEKASLTLKCTYQSSYSDFLFWYVQYKNKELELLLKSSLDNQKVTSRGFEATHISSDSSFHLQKSSVQTSDSAVYYCALSDTVREATGGAEHKPKGTDAVRL